MSAVETVWVYPDFDPVYYGFYLDGLRRLLGTSRVRLASAPFFGAARAPNDDRMSARLIAQAGDRRCQITIESNDMLTFDAASLEWADVIAKVNYEQDVCPVPLRDRVLPIGPGFGVTAWKGMDLALWVARAVGTVRTLSFRRRRALLNLYAHQVVRRLPEQYYVPGASDPDYLFFLAKGWLNYGDVNEPRVRFYQAAQAQSGLRFEGGFVPESIGHPARLNGSLAQRYTLQGYLERTSRSVAVFNNPAVHGCLGWKLGEFLALGKAIISLPIRRVLPAPLEHGEHVHYVTDDEREIADALSRLRKDGAYRSKLEHNARAYYERWVSPVAAARRIMARAGFMSLP